MWMRVGSKTCFPQSSRHPSELSEFSSFLLLSAPLYLISNANPWTVDRRKECVTDPTVYSHPPLHRRRSRRRQRARLRLTPTNRTARSRCRGLEAVPHVNPRHRSTIGLYCHVPLFVSQRCEVIRRCNELSTMNTQPPPFPLILIHGHKEDERRFGHCGIQQSWIHASSLSGDGGNRLITRDTTTYQWKSHWGLCQYNGWKSRCFPNCLVKCFIKLIDFTSIDQIQEVHQHRKSLSTISCVRNPSTIRREAGTHDLWQAHSSSAAILVLP